MARTKKEVMESVVERMMTVMNEVSDIVGAGGSFQVTTSKDRNGVPTVMVTACSEDEYEDIDEDEDGEAEDESTVSPTYKDEEDI